MDTEQSQSLRNEIRVYLEAHRMTLRDFVGTAYFRAYGKPIPNGAHLSDANILETGLDVFGATKPLPLYLVKFYHEMQLAEALKQGE